jgi:TonB-dependent SusC/RagA subfamily outer membrane receptor
MRVIVILSCIVISLYSKAQLVDTSKVLIAGKCFGASQTQINANAKKDISVRIFYLRCMRTIRDDENPLIVVDGIPLENNKLADIKPNDIDSIVILKNSDAFVICGYRAANGVILVTTKNAKARKFIIKDALDNAPVDGATISFISNNKKDTISFIANDSGIVSTDKLKKSSEYEMMVTSTGYNNFKKQYKSRYDYRNEIVLMERQIKNCEPVVLNVNRSRTIHCRCVCYSSRSYNFFQKSDDAAIHILKVFPNPVQSGSALNVGFNKLEEGYYKLQIINQSGQSIHQQKIWIDADARLLSIDVPLLTAGSYFLVLANKKTGKKFTEKLIVQ